MDNTEPPDPLSPHDGDGDAAPSPTPICLHHPHPTLPSTDPRFLEPDLHSRGLIGGAHPRSVASSTSKVSTFPSQGVHLNLVAAAAAISRAPATPSAASTSIGLAIAAAPATSRAPAIPAAAGTSSALTTTATVSVASLAPSPGHQSSASPPPNLPTGPVPSASSSDEADEVELVDWDDDEADDDVDDADDDADEVEALPPALLSGLDAPPPEAPTLAELEAGRAAPPPPSGASSAPNLRAAVAEPSIPPHAPSGCGDCLKSIMVQPVVKQADREVDEGAVLQRASVSPDWQKAKTGRHRRRDASPPGDATTPLSKPRNALEAGHEAIFKKLAGQCFRCLAFDHLVADCRDPVRCLNCMGVGHLSRSCPARRQRAISSQLRTRLVFPLESIHSRLPFPPLHLDCTANITTKPVTENAPRHARLSVGRVGFLKRLDGRCFRCLSFDHQVANCRDRVCCLTCYGVGHISRSCPAWRPHTVDITTKLAMDYRRALLDGHGDQAVERGHDRHRSPVRRARGMDYIPHAPKDWEHRRSCSPVCRELREHSPDGVTPAMHNRNHQYSIPVSLDPLADLCRTLVQTGGIRPREEDPMIQEACSWTDEAAHPRFLSEGSKEALCSSAYKPDTNLGTVGQTPQQAPMDATVTVHTREGDPAGEYPYDDFCSTIFKCIPKPLLPCSSSSQTSPPKRVYSRRKRKNMVATRSSVRLAACPSTVPVAERATRKLMRELDFINKPSPAPDAAVTAFVDEHADSLSEQAIMAIRAATRLDNKELAKALVAIAQGVEEVELEFS